MSERIVRFTLAELKVIRVKCVACGTVTESTFDRLERQEMTACRCGHTIFNSPNGPLFTFSRCVREMLGAADHATFEFTIPMDE
jgi:hypothetical protein